MKTEKKPEKSSRKVKAHQRYRLADGSIVPGVTTITGLLHKPALVPWANRLGLQGIDVKNYVDEKARAGTLAHEMILAYFQKKEVDTTPYNAVEIELAENAFLSYLEWEKGKEIHTIAAEEQLVSEENCFGGTFDLLARLNNEVVLVDFKTGSSIYREYWLQVAAYGVLIQENGYSPPVKYLILNIPRSEDDRFLEDQRSDQWVKEIAWPIFRNLLAVYQGLKRLK